MIRGWVPENFSPYTDGHGYTATRTSTGKYTISFDDPFTGFPTFVATTYNQPDNWITIVGKTNSSVTVESYDHTGSSHQLQDTAFDFIVVGPR